MAEIKKFTKREVINLMLGEELIQQNVVYKEYLENELDLLNKKASRGGSKKVEEENIFLTNMILEEMKKLEATGKEHYTVTELMNSSPIIQNFITSDKKALSNSKVTSILVKLTKEATPRVVNVKDKKNSFYSLAKWKKTRSSLVKSK